MIKRLEQVAALVVAAGLALVSYWLFFSWAQGGGAQHRRLPPPRSMGAPGERGASAEGIGGGRASLISKAAAGFEQPLFGVQIIDSGDVGSHLIDRHRQPQGGADLDDA
jgi:hypothetical protein